MLTALLTIFALIGMMVIYIVVAFIWFVLMQKAVYTFIHPLRKKQKFGKGGKRKHDH